MIKTVAPLILIFLTGNDFAFPQGGPVKTEAKHSPIVCIDPGHSKKTLGAQGKHLVEYQICWRMAVLLREELVREGIRVVLTKKNADEHVENEERAAIANRAHADLF